MKNLTLKIILPVTAALFILTTSANAKTLAQLGGKISLKQKTPVSKVLATPFKYVGKNILIQGKVVDVCTERGCWMKVSSDKKKESITIKVKDGEMVFPVAARGKNVKVEGELFEVVSKESEKEEMKMDKSMKHEHPKAIFMFKPKAVKFE